MLLTALTASTPAAAAGRKAANLGRLIEVEVPVPPALVITRATLTQFLDENGLADRVRSYLAAGPAVTEDQFHELSRAVQNAPSPLSLLDPELARCLEHFAAKAPSGLAVRSSSCHEDAQTASFAGVFASSLCLHRPTDLNQAILRCWCSSWSPRAVTYACHHGISLESDHMAILVQEVAAADSSGVLFTADPHTGNPWTFIINSTFGLARDLVDGTAPADEFTLDWMGDIQEKRIAHKDTRLVPGETGVVDENLPSGERACPSLTDEQIGHLARMALEVDRAFVARMDLEWVLTDGEFRLVQARPITALPPFFPNDLNAEEAKLTWHRTQREPVWPLYREQRDSEAWLMYKPPDVSLGHLEHDDRDVHGYRYSTESVWREWEGSPEELESWLVENEAVLRGEWKAALAQMFEQTQRAAQTQAQTTTAGELIPALLSQRRCMLDFEPMNLGPSQSLGWLCEELLEHTVREHIPDFDIAPLLQGIATYSFERTVAMQELGASIGEPAVRDALLRGSLDGVLPRLGQHHPDCGFLRAYEDFCWRFGMRLPCWERRPPFWSEGGEYDPIQTVFAIRQSLLGRSRDVRTEHTEASARREEYADGIRQRLELRDPALVARFDRVLRWALYWVPLLDERQWYCVGNTQLGELIWEVGVRLVREGLFESPEDVLLFGPEDLDQIAGAPHAAEMKPLAEARTMDWERICRLDPPEYLGTMPDAGESGPTPRARSTEEGRVITGRGYSPGSATGLARRARDLTDPALLDSLGPEDILVCLRSALDGIADWLAILMTVRGLVSVDGPARLHHAVQLARECGVPMVNVKGVADSIPEGSRLDLDGTAGTVSVEPPA